MNISELVVGSCLRHKANKDNEPLVIRVHTETVDYVDGDGNKGSLSYKDLENFDEVDRVPAADCEEYLS